MYFWFSWVSKWESSGFWNLGPIISSNFWSVQITLVCLPSIHQYFTAILRHCMRCAILRRPLYKLGKGFDGCAFQLSTIFNPFYVRCPVIILLMDVLKKIWLILLVQCKYLDPSRLLGVCWWFSLSYILLGNKCGPQNWRLRVLCRGCIV